MVSSWDFELNAISPNSLSLVGNQYVCVKKLNNNILHIFKQKLVSWIGLCLIIFPHESIKFSLLGGNRYFLVINAKISYGLLIKCWE